MAFSLHLQQTIRLFVYNDRNKKLMRILLLSQHNFLKRPITVEMVIEIDQKPSFEERIFDHNL